MSNFKLESGMTVPSNYTLTLREGERLCMTLPVTTTDIMYFLWIGNITDTYGPFYMYVIKYNSNKWKECIEALVNFFLSFLFDLQRLEGE